jgi:hypothetical protein
MPKVRYTGPKGLYQESGTGVRSTHLSVLGSESSGTAIAAAADTIVLSDSDSGSCFTCAVTTQAKVLTLPTSPPIGWTVRIVQIAALGASGTITINALNGTDFIAVGSTAQCPGFAAGGDAAVATDDQLVITGASTNCGWGIGSYLDIVYCREGAYLMTAVGAMTGTGTKAAIFGAQ